MKITHISVKLHFSEKLPDGRWKSLELGREADLAPGENPDECHADLYKDVALMLRTLWNGKEKG